MLVSVTIVYFRLDGVSNAGPVQMLETIAFIISIPG